MSMQDPIADMFTRIRNAQAVGKKEVSIPSSKIKIAIAKVLKDEGYVVDYEIVNNANKSLLLIFLKYYKGKPVIDKISRVSRPGIRIYRSVGNLPKVLGGLGITIVSTPKGIMSDRSARAIQQGGEIIGSVA